MCARLSRILTLQVEHEGLGLVSRVPCCNSTIPRSTPISWFGKEHTGDSDTCSAAPVRSLIVEVFSPATKRRDQHEKRERYMDAGVRQYWMVDPERRAFIVIRKRRENVVVTDAMTWHPDSAASPLVFDVV